MLTASDSGGRTSTLINYIRSGETFQSAASISDQDYDFLDFLGVAQSLQIDFLPITWQPALEKVGEGGTAVIHQALVTIQTSFTFKRLKDEARNLRALIAEISILGHPAIRCHPNIGKIEGICWDVIDGGEEVWPVLAFEKTSCGDLNRFMTSGPGKELDFKARLDMLFDVALAVRDLHATGVIHGDLKPENILIFAENDGCYVAKIIDFGYSTLFATESNLITMPHSGLWTAPERHHRQILPREARKMDAYSFGMLCLWVLFDKEGMNRYCNFEKDIEDSQTRLSNYAFELLMGIPDLENRDKDNMQLVFRLTLPQDPAERTENFDELLEVLSPYRAICLASPVENISIPCNDFLIALSLDQLIEAHYGVRYYIAKCVEKKKDQLSTSRFHNLNLAFCYGLGFGVRRDVVKNSRILLTEHGIQKAHESILETLRELPQPVEYQDGIFRKCFQQGQFQVLDLGQQYRQEQRSCEAESCYRREVMTMGYMLGNSHPIVQQLRLHLSSILSSDERWKDAEELLVEMIRLEEIPSDDQYSWRFVLYLTTLARTYYNQGRWKEAEELEVQILEMRKRAFGAEHLITLNSLGNLAVMYEAQGQWEKAEESNVQVMETRKRVLGIEHPDTLHSMANLASIYEKQNRLKRAEELQEQVVHKSKRALGAEHRETLLSIDHLAFTYGRQERWKEAEKWQTQLVETTKKVLGADHPDTLTRIGNLAWIYRNQNQWEDSFKLQTQLAERSEKVLGADHPEVLTRLANLAWMYCHEKRWKEAEKWQIRSIETSKKVLGADHPKTLDRIAALASTYRALGRCETEEGKIQEWWEKAEELDVRVLKTSRRTIGAEHPDTLSSMINLARTYWGQGSCETEKLKMLERWRKAEELEMQVIEIRKRVLGTEHPDTLESIKHLALSYTELGFENAEELLASVASIYREHGLWEEAEEQEIRILKLREYIRLEKIAS